MRIAIIGAGISGLVSGYFLQRSHEVLVFEKEDWIGGHSCTVDVHDRSGRTIALDVGFLVYNERTYPLFTQLLQELSVRTQPAEMSFSMHCSRCRREYSSQRVTTFLGSTWTRWLDPRQLFLVREVLRFHRLARAWLERPQPHATLGRFLQQHQFSDDFFRHYIGPMTASIWSAPPETVRDFPLELYLRFMDNHGLLSVKNQPQWRTISGGSREYVRRLTAQFSHRIFTRTPVRRVRRLANRVEVQLDSEVVCVDAVILATHSNQALALLSDPTPREAEALSAIRYQENDVVLHTDVNLLPRKRQCWASWNYHVADCQQPTQAVTVTYWINRLQSLPTTTPFCVSLNSTAHIPPERILRRWRFEHPQYDPRVPLAQSTLLELNGSRRTYYVGAYLGYGFHEDGVRSAMSVVQAMERNRAAA